MVYAMLQIVAVDRSNIFGIKHAWRHLINHTQNEVEGDYSGRFTVSHHNRGIYPFHGLKKIPHYFEKSACRSPFGGDKTAIRSEECVNDIERPANHLGKGHNRWKHSETELSDPSLIRFTNDEHASLDRSEVSEKFDSHQKQGNEI